MTSTSFLSVAEARAVSPSVFRSGRRDDFLPADDPAEDPVFPDGEMPTVDEWWKAWFAGDAPNAEEGGERPPREAALLATGWFNRAHFDDKAPAPEMQPVSEEDVEVSDYELVPDPEYVADADMLTPARGEEDGEGPITPETELQRRRLFEEEEERNAEEAVRKAEEELRRATEARQQLERETARAKEEAAASVSARIAQEAVATLREARDLPDRRMSSWTGAKPPRSILKNRHSVAPVVQFSADNAPDLTADEGEEGVQAMDALNDYESVSSPSTRRTSVASMASRSRSGRRASMPAPATVGVAGSRRKSTKGRRSRRSTAGIQMGGRLVHDPEASGRSRRSAHLVDYESSQSTRSRKSSLSRRANEEEEEDDEEREVPPETLARMRRVSEAAPPPVLMSRGTMVRESVASAAELTSLPEEAQPGLVNAAIQCNGEEIDAELRIMFADFTVVKTDGADVPPTQADAAEAAAEKAPVEDEEEDEPEPEPEPEPPIEYTDQPFEVQTPGHTVTYDKSKSFVPRKPKAADAPETEKEKRLRRRLSVKGGGELFVEEFDEEEDEDAPDASPDATKRTPADEPTSAIQENLGLHIPQSTGRKSTGRGTPHRSRKTPSGSVAGSRKSRRASKRNSTVAQSLDFADASPQQAEEAPLSRRRSSRQGAGEDVPAPFFMEEAGAFQSKVMELEIPEGRGKKGRRGRKFVYNGKSVVDGVAGFSIEPEDVEEADEEGGVVDLVSPSPGPSARSRQSKRATPARSSLRNASAILKGSKKGVSFPAETARQKKRTATDISPCVNSRGSKKRVTREMQDMVDVVSARLSDNDDLEDDGVEDEVPDPSSARTASGRSKRSSAKSASSAAAPSGRSTRSGRKASKETEASPVPTVSGRNTRSGRKPAKEADESPVAGRSGRSSQKSATASQPRRGRSARKNARPAESSRTSRRTTRSSQPVEEAENIPVMEFEDGDLDDDLVEDGTINIDDDDIEVVEESPRARRSSQRSRASAAAEAADAAAEAEEEQPTAARRRGSQKSKPAASAASTASAATDASKPRRRAKHGKKEMPRELRHLNVNALAAADGDDEGMVRRSKRQRFPTLRFWSNEKLVYERRKSQIMPTIAQVVVALPEGEEGEGSLSSNASWLARGQIPLQTAGEENSAPTESKGKGRGRRGRKRARA